MLRITDEGDSAMLTGDILYAVFVCLCAEGVIYTLAFEMLFTADSVVSLGVKRRS